MRDRSSLIGKHFNKKRRFSPVPASSRVWSYEETEELLKGVKKYGVGQWRQILEHFHFGPHRTTTNLQDKWRNIQGRRQT